MNSLETELKKNGLLLKNIPNKERTEQQCCIAVQQNPHALKYVPYKYQTEKLLKQALRKDSSVFHLISKRALTEKICLYAVKQDSLLLAEIDSKYLTDKVYKAALSGSVECLRYINSKFRLDSLITNPTPEFINKCLDWIKKDITASEYLPKCVKKDHRILQYQKEQHILFFLDRYYSLRDALFCVKVQVNYGTVLLKDSSTKSNQYSITTVFTSFDDFYSFLDGDLQNAMLLDYDFEGIDLYSYNISGAVIDSDVLVSQGLYDDSYFTNLINNKRLEVPQIKENDALDIPDNRELDPAPFYGTLAFEENKIPIYYISDIHLTHRVFNKFKDKGRATRAEVLTYIRFLAKHIVKTPGIQITRPKGLLLIAGDTASNFEYTEVFYQELVQHWEANRIFVIPGNHELWDPPIDMAENIDIYRNLCSNLGIHFLFNELICLDDEFLYSSKNTDPSDKNLPILQEDQILKISSQEMHALASQYPLLILGGIGFSGLNEQYNATNIRYGISFESLSPSAAREKEIYESSRFNAIYSKLVSCIPDKRLLVLTHMRKENWNAEKHIPFWIYINGHDHRNYYEISEYRTVYADNQIGYKSKNISLKYFYTDSDYDIFSDWSDGIHQISIAQYNSFNRGKRITSSFSRTNGNIYMLKQHENYMFVYYGKFKETSKDSKFYLLNGGSLKKTNIYNPSDLQYYYDNIEIYVQNVQLLLDRYTGVQKKISMFIKNLGGSGRIHGCIIDIDQPGIDGFSYNHIFLNPWDGSVTPYFAVDITSRVIYRDLKTLLENRVECKKLLIRYKRIETKKPKELPALRYSRNMPETIDNEDYYDDSGSYIYKWSRIVRSLQYCIEKNCIRYWNENLLDLKLIERAMIPGKADDLKDTGLILSDDIIENE